MGVCAEWNRKRAAAALTLPAAALDSNQRNAIRTLAVSVELLGDIQREQGKSECVATYEDAITLSQRINDKEGAAVTAFNLGHAYKNLSALRDLAQAEHWYRRSLELRDERDRQGQAKCLSQLGLVAYEHFKEARATKQPKAELLRHLNSAVAFYNQALELPENAVNDLAVAHHALGAIYDDAGDLDRALSHNREAIRYFEAAGDLYRAATTRYNVAVGLMSAGRLSDAAEYARAALHNLETYGQAAAADIQKTQQLLAKIEQAIR